MERSIAKENNGNEGLNDELFIDFVCRNIGLSEAEYEELMTENTAE